MLKRKALLEWILAIVLVIAGIVCWKLTSAPNLANAGSSTDPCNSSPPTD